MARRGGFRKSNKPKRQRTAPHNIADDFEKEKHLKELEKFLRQLDEDGSPKKHLTDSQILSLARGAIRDRWMFSNTKLAYLNQGIIPDDDPNTRRRWKCQCESCEKWFGKNDIQVDHKVGEHSLKTVEDIIPFADSILNVTFDQLQLLCEECHTIKTAMERYNLTEDEAITFKKVTSWEKKFTKANDQKEFLISKGFKASEVSNSDKRRQAALEYFKDKP